MSIVASVKEAVKAHLADGGSIAELQEAQIIDAEIVDDGPQS